MKKQTSPKTANESSKTPMLVSPSGKLHIQRKKQLTRKQIDYLFYVDCENGKLYWKHRKKPKKKVGHEAGSIHKTNRIKNNFYCNILINKKLYKRHNIIYFYSTGKYPDNNQVIDHINKNSIDDRICNLRIATLAQNMYNKSKYIKKSSLPQGVDEVKANKIYRARIRVNKKAIDLGCYKTPTEANKKYLEARKIYFGEFA